MVKFRIMALIAISVMATGCSTTAHVHPGDPKPKSEIARIVAVPYPTLAIMGVDNEMLPGTSFDVRYENVFVLPDHHVIHVRWSGRTLEWTNGTVEIDAIAGETYYIKYRKKAIILFLN